MNTNSDNAQSGGTAVDTRPTRRAVARGAAWSVPAVALGAAAPAMAASTGCGNNCFTPITAVTGTTLTAYNPANNTGTLTVVGPPPPSPSGFALIYGCAAIVSAGLAVVRSATLTMSGSATPGGTLIPGNVTYTANALGAGVAAGGLGVGALYIAGAFSFPNVRIPNGLYAGVGPADTSPIRPVQLCLEIGVPVSFGVPGTSTACCNYRLCFDVFLVGATAGQIETVPLAPNTITYASSFVLGSQQTLPSSTC